MKKFYPLLWLILATLPLQVLAQKKFTAVPSNAAEAAPLLGKMLRKYALYQINMAQIDAYIQQNASGTIDFELELSGYATLPFAISRRDILSSNYKLIVGNADGRQELPKPECITYTGHLSNDISGISIVNLTITDHSIYGSINGNGKRYFIEPLNYYDKAAASGTFVIYETKDVVPLSGITCGVTDVFEKAQQLKNGNSVENIEVKATGQCRMVEVAIASDDSMLIRYGTPRGVEEHNIGVMNTMVGLYSNAQLSGPQYLEFKIAGQYVASFAGANPLRPAYDGPNASIILTNFASWGNAGNFGITYDLAQMWTTSNIASETSPGVFSYSTIGLAYIGAVCQSSKYQLLEDAGLTGAQRGVLAAHETGHNLSANHDAGNLYIMAPSVGDPPATDFSAGSITAFSNYINGSGGICITECNLSAPVPQFSASSTGVCTGGSVTFTNYSVGEVTSFSWSFPGGTPATSTAASQVVSYATPGIKTATLTVTNAFGTRTISKPIYVADAPVTACRTYIPFTGNDTTKFTAFTLADISFAGPGFYIGFDNVYTNLTCSNNTVLLPGLTYTATAQVGYGEGGFNFFNKVEMYLDYNNDGDFLDANETIHMSPTCVQGDYQMKFALPPTVPVANQFLRLRVIVISCQRPSSNGCSIPSKSITRDFAVYFPATSCITYVNASATGANNGTSWADAFTDLMPALSATSNCISSQIWVAQGTYKPTSGTDRDISFYLKNGVAIYGGFPNTGNPLLAQRNPATFTTTLSGDIGSTASTDNSYHVISNSTGLTNSAVLDGFVITGGYADGASFLQRRGGGFLNGPPEADGFGNPRIENCRFVNNTAYFGGAVSNSCPPNGETMPRFINCIFENNTALTDGGAMHNSSPSFLGRIRPQIINCTFYNNYSPAAGGGRAIYNNGTSATCIVTATNNIFFGNGGPLSFQNVSASILARNNLFEPLVTNYTNTSGNITSAVSPFVNASNLRLSEASLAIDAGLTDISPQRDLDTILRTAVPDMGAYENTESCLGSNKTFWSDSSGVTYQWQRNNGSGFVDIANGAAFGGVASNKLTIIAPADITTGHKFRCRVVTAGGATVYSSEFTLRFYNRWLGSANNNWQNAANWSCGIVPNQYTDVIVPSAKSIYPLTNVSGTIRRLQAQTGSSVRLTTGSSLVIVGKD